MPFRGIPLGILDDRYINEAGDDITNAPVDADNTSYRWYYNRGTDAQNDIACIQVGGTYDGSAVVFGYPPNFFNGQLVAVNTNRVGNGTYDVALMTYNDSNVNNKGIASIAGMTYGNGTYGLFFGGGTNLEDIFVGFIS